MFRDLDPFTWFVAACLCAGMSAWMFWGLARLMPAYRLALRAWSMGMVCAAGTFLLMAVRGVQPHGVFLVMSNLLLLGMAGYIVMCFRHLRGQHAPAWFMAWLGLMAWSGPALHEAGLASYDLAVLSMCLGVGGFLAWAAWLAWRLPGRGVSSLVCAFTSGLVSLGMLGRAASAAQAQAHPLLSAGPTPEMQALLVFGLIWLVAASLGLSSYVHDRHQQDILDAARRDGLSGLLTRKAFVELAAPRLRALEEPVAMVMFDIDHFKAINDTHGHAVGDQVIAHVARLLAGTVRLSDLVGRYGGEEFCVLLPGCDQAQAEDLAWRVVRETARRPVRRGRQQGLTCTVSAGVAQARPDESLEALMDRADRALYQAKRQGRNQACVAPDAPTWGDLGADSPFRGLSENGSAG